MTCGIKNFPIIIFLRNFASSSKTFIQVLQFPREVVPLQSGTFKKTCTQCLLVLWQPNMRRKTLQSDYTKIPNKQTNTKLEDKSSCDWGAEIWQTHIPGPSPRTYLTFFSLCRNLRDWLRWRPCSINN